MKIGIVGLGLSGKTTLFNALTGSQVETAAYSGKAEAHRAIVNVPDERLDALNEIFKPRKKTPATIEYVDLAGISTAEQKKGGFSDQFLGLVRTVDALLVLLRHFADDSVPHPLESVDPLRDLKTIETDFIISDLSIIENRMARLEKQMRTKKSDQDAQEYELLQRCKKLLEEEKPLRIMEMSREEQLLVRGYQFLSQKPVILCLNIGENDIRREEEVLAPFAAYRLQPHTALLAISAKIEMEILQLSPDEAELFRNDLGIVESAMGRLIRTSYDLVGLISFFTVGEDEVRAWTIRRNTPAPIAAGAIHTDIERGFIRAEVVHYNDFITRKSLAQCRADGVLRLEGREYIVKDGDIINFRFAV
ncbi:MAG: redox-regulated ATPase YchF [candidate division KSB1 bacterium]|nr:redox-regulated ATPase YchF [candidate division KSB1 bacterium]